MLWGFLYSQVHQFTTPQWKSIFIWGNKIHFWYLLFFLNISPVEHWTLFSMEFPYFQLLHITKREFCNVVSRAIRCILLSTYLIENWHQRHSTHFVKWLLLKPILNILPSFSLSWNSYIHSFSLPDVSAYIFLSWSNFIIDL